MAQVQTHVYYPLHDESCKLLRERHSEYVYALEDSAEPAEVERLEGDVILLGGSEVNRHVDHFFWKTGLMTENMLIGIIGGLGVYAGGRRAISQITKANGYKVTALQGIVAGDEVLVMRDYLANGEKAVETPPATMEPAEAAEGLYIRMVDMPKMKMAIARDPDLGKFTRWWSGIDAKDPYRVSQRDFMWWNPNLPSLREGLYAVASALEDHGGFGTFDFAGGLYAVTTCKEAELSAARKKVRDWLRKSELFEFDDQAVERYDMVQRITPRSVKERVGYYQIDVYVPIRLKSQSGTDT